MSANQPTRKEWARRDAEMGAEITGADVGRLLREARRKRGISLQQVEEFSDGKFSAVTVGSWERGDRRPTVPVVSALFAWYDVGYRIAITRVVMEEC